MFMNAQRIRERWHRDTKPFVFRLSDGTRVPVAHPDFMMMPPGFGLIIVFGRKGGERRIDPLHVVAIEEVPPRRAKADGKRNFELGVWTTSPELIDAVLEQFNALWEGERCKTCRRKDVCPVPLEEPRL